MDFVGRWQYWAWSCWLKCLWQLYWINPYLMMRYFCQSKDVCCFLSILTYGIFVAFLRTKRPEVCSRRSIDMAFKCNRNYIVPNFNFIMRHHFDKIPHQYCDNTVTKALGRNILLSISNKM